MDEEQIQQPKDQVEKIFEDDNTLIVSPLTVDANRYYGQRSPWYEEGYHGNRKFEERLENGGKIYYIVDKKTGEKDGFYKDEYGQVFYNEITKLQKDDIEDLIKFAPTARKVIFDITGSDVFKKLRQYAKGKIHKNILINSDDLIYDVKENKESPGDSIILLRYDEDEGLFDAMDLSDDDIWFLNIIISRDYEFIDGDRMWEDNKEGYGIFRWFNAKNMQKLMEISKLVLPGEQFNEKDENFMGKLYIKLDEHFDRQMSRMNWDYIEEYNEKSSEFARNEIQKEIDSYLNQKEFHLIRNYDTISTTIADLIYHYSIMGRRHDDLKELLKVVLAPTRKDKVGGWGENYYEYEGEIDVEKLNEEFEFQLEKIWDSLYDDDNMKEYFGLYERIVSKYKLNAWHSTPKDAYTLFRIKNIDPNTLKLLVDLRKSGSNDWDKTHYFTEENFNKFLHQPELFSIFDEK